MEKTIKFVVIRCVLSSWKCKKTVFGRGSATNLDGPDPLWHSLPVSQKFKKTIFAISCVLSSWKPCSAPDLSGRAYQSPQTPSVVGWGEGHPLLPSHFLRCQRCLHLCAFGPNTNSWLHHWFHPYAQRYSDTARTAVYSSTPIARRLVTIYCANYCTNEPAVTRLS